MALYFRACKADIFLYYACLAVKCTELYFEKHMSEGHCDNGSNKSDYNFSTVNTKG